MYKLKITVTQEILDSPHTCKKNTRHCAISLAVRDIFPEARVGLYYIAPFVSDEVAMSIPGLSVIRLDYELNEGMNFPLGDRMSSYIVDFDHGLPMKPASFDLEIPDWVIEKINIDEIKQILVDHPTLELIEA